MPVDVTGAHRASSRATKVATFTLSVLILIATVAAPALGSEPVEWDSTVPADIGMTLAPGDRVLDFGIEVVVPQPGESVWAALEYADGTAQELQVMTALDGTVRMMSIGDDTLRTHVSIAGSRTST